MDDKIFLEMAEVLSKESHCVSRKVGALIVKDERIVSIGYNGTPAGYVNCDDEFNLRGPQHSKWSSKYEIHAEMNAILYAAKNGIKVHGSTLYCTLQPCWQCSKNIIQAGVQKVVFSKKYPRLKNENKEIINFLKENGVCVNHLKKFNKGT